MGSKSVGEGALNHWPVANSDGNSVDDEAPYITRMLPLKSVVKAG